VAVMFGHDDGVESQILEMAQLCCPPRSTIASPRVVAEPGHRREEAEGSGGSHGDSSSG
jgi:hypothetical protein